MPEEPNKPYLNGIAKSLLDKLIPQYEFLKKEMRGERESGSIGTVSQDGKYLVGQKYLEYQLSWFGKKYSVEDDIALVDKEKARKEFIDFLEQYANDNIHIAKENQGGFRKEFTELYEAAYQREDPNGRPYGKKKINDLLKIQKLKYKIESVGNPVEWVVEEKVVKKRGTKIKIEKSVLDSISTKNEGRKKKHIQL